jgi:WhiB family redox-sensing transcriptional regulator
MRDAKALCAVCPVSADCLTYALPEARLMGVWGGTSERERRRIRKSRKAA